jgi:hypothetical protein
MVNKIFKKKYPLSDFKRFCDTHFKKTYIDNNIEYQFDFDIFKKLEFYNEHTNFSETLKEYYYPSKYFYLTRKLTYKNFATIIRQICRSIDINFQSKIKYKHNQSFIMYIISIKQNNH